MDNLQKKSTEDASKALTQFLHNYKLLKAFKYNSALYMFPKYKHNHIMGYINPKYCNAPLVKGPDIFNWSKAQEGSYFWTMVYDLWRAIVTHSTDKNRIKYLSDAIQQTLTKKNEF